MSQDYSLIFETDTRQQATNINQSHKYRMLVYNQFEK